MVFADLELSRRLELTEGRGCVDYAIAHRRVSSESGAEWMECAGTYVVFDGVTSPITQTFGLGLFEDLTPAALDDIERFFRDRGAPVIHEVSPFAGTATLNLLCDRGYRPIELSTVLFREIETPKEPPSSEIRVRAINPAEANLWSDVSARGWSQEAPELEEFLRDLGAVMAVRENGVCFLAEIGGEAGASGGLSIHQGVALFAGASTIPSMRRRGLQNALLRERMRYSYEHGCDLAMMVTLPGTDSQRNAERNGFRVAYTRVKWKTE